MANSARDLRESLHITTSKRLNIEIMIILGAINTVSKPIKMPHSLRHGKIIIINVPLCTAFLSWEAILCDV